MKTAEELALNSQFLHQQGVFDFQRIMDANLARLRADALQRDQMIWESLTRTGLPLEFSTVGVSIPSIHEWAEDEREQSGIPPIYDIAHATPPIQPRALHRASDPESTL